MLKNQLNGLLPTISITAKDSSCLAMKMLKWYEWYDRMSEERYRLVVLGSAKVGKTNLIRRYLYNEFSEKYKETIEDLHSRQFRIQGVPLPLDILDTNFNFPDMRRLSIASASAFLLVFAVDDVRSFKEVHSY
uniref:Ras family protein n=1 Tax=Heterorhabditis bacteriophora TaxID=37862 RepID=A0A1I7WWX1_HETBA